MSLSLNKKYAESMAYAMVNAKPSEAGIVSDFLAKAIFEEGLSLNSLSIMKEAERLALNEIKKRTATIHSREALDSNIKVRLEQSVKNKFGEDLVFEEKIDPSLISGVVIELFGLKIDASALGGSKKLLEHIKS